MEMRNNTVARRIRLMIVYQCLYTSKSALSFEIERRSLRSSSLQTIPCLKQNASLQCNGNKELDESFNEKDFDTTFMATQSSRDLNPPKSSKLDLYTSDELMNLLNIHTNLSESLPEFASPGTELEIEESTSNTPSLHDLITQTVQNIETESSPSNDSEDIEQLPSITLKFQSSLTESDFLDKIPKIRAIASDVDGTLLGSDHSLHPLTEQAIVNAVEASYSPIHPIQYFFPATGKTKTGALNSLGSKMKSLLQQSPGVYVQGLYCVDGLGKVIYEKKLAQIAVEQVEALVAEQSDVTLVAYDGDNLYINELLSHKRHVDDVSVKWGERPPILLNHSYSIYESSFHKILLMGDDPDVISKVLRPKLEKLASSLDCVVTQAIPTMLELLPGGCSKALGVQKLCESFGIDLSTQVCAIGDAENDYDMIRLASIGIAVGNAVPAVQDVADIVMDDTSTNGAAGQAIELFGLGKVMDLL